MPPLLLSAFSDGLKVNFTKLEDTKWEYFYNATAMSAENITFTTTCNDTAMACIFAGLASSTEYRVYMEACMTVEGDTLICSRFSEALVAWTTAQG